MDKNKCSSCGEAPQKCSCKNKEFTKAVIEIDNPPVITNIRKVLVPASMGDETAVPPTIGKYHNVLLEYEASGGIYLYSSDGIPTKLSSDVTELQAQLNALRARVGEEEVARADADTTLSNRITSLDNSLATVAKTGSYNDLSDKPTIGNGTLTIKKNGAVAGTFTANATTNKEIDISIPTRTSDLTNDGSDGTSTYVEADELSTVATTGSYNDLTNKPTIPTVNNATLTIQKNGTNVQTFTANSSTNKTANITVPTAVSELTNDAGYATTTQLNDGLATKQNTLTAGNNIQINGNTISATDTTYTAGNAIDITNGEISADIHPADFFTASDSVSDCGSNLSLDNTIATTLKSVELKGDTEQQTYSGFQLLQKQGLATPTTDRDFWYTVTDQTITALEDGWARFTSSSSSASKNFFFNRVGGFSWEVATTYTVICEIKNAPSAGRLTLSQPQNASDPFASVSTGVQADYLFNGTDYTFVFSGTTKASRVSMGLRPFFSASFASGSSVDLRLTIVAGDHTADYQNYIGDNWEPYTGGIPAPNPDYPQDIQVVTGEQTVNISDGVTSIDYIIDLTGKNLFDKTITPSYYDSTTVSQITDGLRVISTGTGSSRYVRYLLFSAKDYIGKTITLSTNMQASASNTPRVVLGLCDANGDNRLPKITLDSSWLGSYLVEDDPSREYFFLNLYCNTNGTLQVGDYVDYTNIQLEVDSELCKIGDYQDYIYKSGDDWYLHKEMGRIALDGSETWSATQTTNNWLYYTTNAGMAVVTSSQMPNIASNYFSVTTADGQWTSVAGSKSVTLSNTASPNTQIRFTVGDSTNKLADFKTWLSTHNTIIYYPLATPTDTKITDATLVGQLEALAGAMSYNGQTNILVTTAGGNLPATLCVEAYRKSLSGVIEAIDSACTCRKNLVVHLPNGMTTYENNDAPIPIPEVLEALKRGQSVFLVDDRLPENVYVVTAASAEDGIWSMRADQTGINADDNDGYWHINGRDNLWRRVEFVPDTPGEEEATHLVLSNPTTATWSGMGSVAIPYPSGAAVGMGTFASTDVVFTKDDGTTMTVRDLYTALTNGKSFEIDLPFGEINSACYRGNEYAAIIAAVENAKLDGSSKQTFPLGISSEMYVSSVPVMVRTSLSGYMLLDERFGVKYTTVDDDGTVTSDYRFIVDTYDEFAPPN